MYEEEMNEDEQSSIKEDISLTKKITECPNSKESLGFFTWNFLHTMGAYYPESPDKQTQKDMTSF